MRAYDIIKKKRDGFELTKEEIDFFIQGYTDGEIPDYQAAAFCMAVYFQGMSSRETADLTFAIRDSGSKPDFSSLRGVRADKHSTGGVGDKTSLVVAPIVASCGVIVAKMSGRGLGHTGGTVDKLEAIPGFKTEVSEEELISVVKKTGIAIVGQTRELAPADKKLYALRDVTATVDSIPLIAASIMGKKLCADDDVIVLDVKVGSGAFMKTKEEAELLARTMVDIGKRAGKKTVAFLTDMDRPIGKTIGNALEVREAIETLSGRGDEEFLSLCVTLATEMLYLSGTGERKACEQKVSDAIKTGKALRVFTDMVREQGGESEVVLDPKKLKIAEFSYQIKSQKDGYIVKTDAEEYGKVGLLLGAGRDKKEDKIDYGAGIVIQKKTGDFVRKGETIATLYSSKEDVFFECEKRIQDATIIADKKAENKPIIIGRIE